jgi:hypothetical protein
MKFQILLLLQKVLKRKASLNQEQKIVTPLKPENGININRKKSFLNEPLLAMKRICLKYYWNKYNSKSNLLKKLLQKKTYVFLKNS